MHDDGVDSHTVTPIGGLQLHAQYSRGHQTSVIFSDLRLTRKGVTRCLRTLQTPASISHSATHWFSQVLSGVYFSGVSVLVVVVVVVVVVASSALVALT
jgi:hypothetical protein